MSRHKDTQHKQEQAITTFGMRVSPETKKNMKKLAALKGTSVSKTITHLVEQELASLEKEELPFPKRKVSIDELRAMTPEVRFLYLQDQARIYGEHFEYIPGGEELIDY